MPDMEQQSVKAEDLQRLKFVRDQREPVAALDVNDALLHRGLPYTAAASLERLREAGHVEFVDEIRLCELQVHTDP